MSLGMGRVFLKAQKPPGTRTWIPGTSLLLPGTEKL
jgi:hypothetical protein